MNVNVVMRRAIILTLTSFFALAICAASVQAQKWRFREIPTSNGDLQVVLSTPIWTLECKSSLELKLELTNLGPETIRIDKADLWSHFRYSYLEIKSEQGGSGGVRNGGSGRGCSHNCRGTFLEIPPGSTRAETFTLQLDEDFYYESGKYSLSTSLNYLDSSNRSHPAESNRIEFELFNCGGKKESEEDDNQR